jgi:hypothetical protein
MVEQAMAGLVKANSTLTKEISRQKSPSHNGFQLLLGQKAFHESCGFQRS